MLKNVEHPNEHRICQLFNLCHFLKVARLGSFASEAATVYFIQLQWSESQRLKKTFKGHSRNNWNKNGIKW